MKYRSVLYALILTLQGRGQEENPEADLAWGKYVTEKMSAIPEIPSAEDIRFLTQIASTKKYTSPPIQSAREEAWRRLSSLPDFPDQILESIHAERAKWKAGEWRSDYDMVRFQTIEAMKKLEHPGIVRILGELLWDTERTAGENEAGPPSNARYACRSLAELMENPPVKRLPDTFRAGDLETWQLWYEQIRAGTRTFRFKGNPQECTLLGPVSAVAHPSDKPSLKKNPSAVAGAQQAPAPAVSAAALISSSLILGFAIVVFLRARKKKA